MLMEIDPLSMRGSMVMTMATISPSRRDVSPAEQLRRSPRLVSPGSASRWRSFIPKASFWFFPGRKTSYSQRWAPETCQGAHEAGGAPRGVGRAPTLVDGGWPPSGAFFAQYFFYILKLTFVKFQDFWSCAEYVSNILLLFQPRIQLPAFSFFM